MKRSEKSDYLRINRKFWDESTVKETLRAKDPKGFVKKKNEK